MRLELKGITVYIIHRNIGIPLLAGDVRLHKHCSDGRLADWTNGAQIELISI
jgi:hypothetical protein